MGSSLDLPLNYRPENGFAETTLSIPAVVLIPTSHNLDSGGFLPKLACDTEEVFTIHASASFLASAFCGMTD